MSDTGTLPFIELCLMGKVLTDEIDDFVERWHEQENDQDLHEFLGMTIDEYSVWVEEPAALSFIVMARKRKLSIRQIIEELESLPMAARTDRPAEAEKVRRWLEKREAFAESILLS